MKRLELQGFKSFADKTVLEFKPGITAVIGPNGSGKSNISDSIRWVLGEQSMKSLRGAKAEDVIFAGTQNRKSLGFAEASIVIDNSDGKLPIEYNEVTVTRKLYRSGETGYFINKTPCRLKDIIELFMDTGIGKDGYSIIGQGKIDEILSNKSDDRRHIFEEAAGIVKYRTRKVESEKKLEQTKLNLLRINDILSEIEGQLDPLKLQADKARKFLDLREELKSIEVGLFVYNINTYKEKLEQIVEDLQILKDQETSESQKLEEGQNKKDILKTRIDELIAEIENMQNVGFESKTKIEQLNSQINVSKERISNNATNIERLTKEIEELHQRINDFNEEKDSKVSKKDNLFKNKEKFEKELKEKEEELAKISAKLSEKELEIEGKKKQVEADTDAKYERLAEINTYEINYENLEKTKKNVKQELQSTISELDSNRIKKQEISKNFQEIEATRNKAVKTLTEIKAQKEEALAVIKDFDEKINKLTAEYRMKDSRCKFLIETERDKDGYMKSVKSLLLACEQNSELNAGVEGVLASLISVDKKYETAIEMCLGQAMQNIVTKTETDAKKLIEHLRKNNLGRASFLPISSVHGKKIEKVNSNGIDGVIGIAADLVKADKKYQDIILNLLGRTVIVENMDSAIKLAKANSYSFRIVTLEGDVINPSGAISGGSVAQKTVNILGRSREIEELKAKLEELNSEIKKLEKEKEEHSVKIADTIEESARLEKNLQEIEITYATKSKN
ncbi:MAG: chromosome segregation protein SMC [Clostridia bacterium]